MSRLMPAVTPISTALTPPPAITSSPFRPILPTAPTVTAREKLIRCCRLICPPRITIYTYFNSTYAAASDYIITIPPNPSDSANSHGQGKIDSLLQTYLPATNNDLAALLVNDGVPGGSDNYGNTAITSIPNVSYILIHESGHALGRLVDEYDSAYPGYPDIEEP